MFDSAGISKIVSSIKHFKANTLLSTSSALEIRSLQLCKVGIRATMVSILLVLVIWVQPVLPQTQGGHTNEVAWVAFSPNGRTLASASRDGTIKIWEVQTGDLLRTLVGHEGQVESVAFSPDGETLASCGQDLIIRFWNVKTGEPLQSLEGHELYVASVAFSPDGKVLASGSEDASVQLWNPQSGELLRVLRGHRGYVWWAVFSPDSKTLVSTSSDRNVRLWDVQTGELLKTLSGHKNPVETAVFSPDGETLASASKDGEILFWNVQTGELLKKLTEDTGSNIEALDFSWDGNILASGSWDGTVRFWGAKTGEALWKLEGHGGRVRSVDFSPDGKILASGHGDGGIRLWNVETGELVRTIEGGRRLALPAKTLSIDTYSIDIPSEAYVPWKPAGDLPDLELALEMSACEAAGKAGYFVAKISSENEVKDMELTGSDGDLYLIHPVKPRTDEQGRKYIFGRFSSRPEKVTVQGKLQDKHFTATFSGSIRPENIPSLPREWAKARIDDLVEMMSEYGRIDFCAHEILRLAGKYGIETKEWRSRRFWRRSEGEELDELFAVATGAAAIEESLQLEALKQVQESAVTEQVVPVTELVGPEIKSHPYEEMLGSSAYDIEDIASLVPFDCMYTRFASADAAYQFLDFMDLWGTDVLRIRNLTSDADRMVRRVEEQLCIEFDRGLEPFVSLVVSDIAVVFGDPYVYESADISLIFHLKNKALFESTANKWFGKARSQQKSLQEEQLTHTGISIRSYVTDDRKISSYSAYISDYAVYSNNLPAMKHILDTHAGEVRSLAKTGDFKYMRSIFRSAEEEGFVYMGDDFVRKVVSPVDKFKVMRRFTCRDNMLRLEDALLAYHTENKQDASLLQLFGERFLAPFPACPDGGAYELMEGVVSCSVHGRRDAMNQLSALSVQRVTQGEKELYEGFKSRYHDFFRQYFDPIGIQIRMGEEITLKTCILPLIQNSVYRPLETIVGGAPVDFETARAFPADAVAGVFLKLRIFDDYQSDMSHIPDAELRDALSNMKQDIEESIQWDLQQDILSWIGNEVIIGAHDSMPSLTSSEVFVIVELRDSDLAQKVIDRLLETLGSGAGLIPEAVITIEHKGYPIKLVATGFGVTFALGFTDDLLILGSNDRVVRRTIDMITSESPAEPLTEDKCNLLLHINLEAAQILKKYLESHSARLIQRWCQRNRTQLEAIIETFGQDLEMAGKEIPEAISLLKKQPYCPEGGEYSYSLEEGVVCGVHGLNREPKYTNSLYEPGRLRRLFDQIKQLNISLEFTEHGIMTGLRVDNPVYKPGTGGIFGRLWEKQ